MIRKWLAIVTDHRVSLRERMFRIVTFICMLALIFTLPMGRSLLNILLLLAGLVAIALIAKFSTQPVSKCHLAYRLRNSLRAKCVG